MGKVSKIKKSRKPNKCQKCGKDLPVGSEYLRGSLNFSRDIVRCTSCGLQSWEVTSSEYLLRVGQLANNWESDYEMETDIIENLTSELEELRDETQEKHDNMPDSLQESDTGCLLQERADQLEEAISELSNIEFTDFVDEEGIMSDEQREELVEAINEALGCLQ